MSRAFLGIEYGFEMANLHYEKKKTKYWNYKCKIYLSTIF